MLQTGLQVLSAGEWSGTPLRLTLLGGSPFGQELFQCPRLQRPARASGKASGLSRFMAAAGNILTDVTLGAADFRISAKQVKVGGACLSQHKHLISLLKHQSSRCMIPMSAACTSMVPQWRLNPVTS